MREDGKTINKSKVSRISITFAKVIISAALVIYLFFILKIDITQVALSLKGVNILWLILGFLLLGVGRLITAYRWQILLSRQSIHISVRTLLVSLFTANFFNLFLPSTIGGDAVRAYDISRHSGRTGTSIMTIVIERILGVFALVAIAFCALIFAYCFRRVIDQKEM